MTQHHLWHACTQEEVFHLLEANESGLSNREAEKRLREYGINSIEELKATTPWELLVRQFNDFLIWILLGAALLSFVTGETMDGTIILVIVGLNALIGFYQEYNAENALLALKKMIDQLARVKRNGQWQQIAVKSLVPGDIVAIEGGDVVPADLRLLESNNLEIDEAALTGESLSVAKHTSPLSPDTPPADRRNMAFKGTYVVKGKGTGVVVATGLHTEFGKIAAHLAGQEDTETPLKRNLRKFGRMLTYWILLLCLLFFIYGYWRGQPWLSSFMLAVSLAVAAVPEALPALITLALSKGAYRLSEKKALVRRLYAVESLGSISVICTDKTGTLTENKMTVKHLRTTGEGGEVRLQGRPLADYVLTLCNDVQIKDGEPVGAPTETALVQYMIEREGIEVVKQLKQEYPVIDELPFDSGRKRMSVLVEVEGQKVLLSKGAVESIASICKQRHEVLQQTAAEWAARGMRVLALAYRFLTDEEAGQKERYEQELTFLGVVAIYDPPRKGIEDVIATCKQAGIIPVMITGDHPNTARFIARQIGIIDNEEEQKVVSGRELEAQPQYWQQHIEQCRVFARVTPEQKLLIVKAFRQKGHVVAMTGDGVNDAPSLKAADVGVAMGINGTEVTKSVADVVLMDDRYETILAAIKEGRNIYANIRKFVKYTFSSNLAEILVVILSPLLGLGNLLYPIHVLWINLMTDGLPGIALGYERETRNLMKLPPRKPDESLFARGNGEDIPVIGGTMFALVYGVVTWAMQHLPNVDISTLAFNTLVFLQLTNAVGIRKEYSLTGWRLYDNPVLLITLLVSVALQWTVTQIPLLGRYLKTQPLPPEAWALCVVPAAGLLLVNVLLKWKNRRYYAPKGS